jgi:thymidylate kinase
VNRVIEQWYRSITAMYHLVRGRFVIYDRYMYDSWLISRKMNWRKRLRRGLLEICCAPPDLVILLDAPGEVLFQRKGEHSPEWLEQQRQGYLKLAERLPQMCIIDAQQSAEQVRRQATSLIWRAYGARDSQGDK